MNPFAPHFVTDTDARPACAGQWQPFEALIDYLAAPARDVIDADALCSSCPIRLVCHAENVDEDWLKQLRGRRAQSILAAHRRRVEAAAARASSFCACGALRLKHKRVCATCREKKDAA